MAAEDTCIVLPLIKDHLMCNTDADEQTALQKLFFFYSTDGTVFMLVPLLGMCETTSATEPIRKYPRDLRRVARSISIHAASREK